MKKLIVVMGILLMALACQFAIGAAGSLQREPGGDQKIQGHSSLKSTIRNDTKTGTKVFQNVSTVTSRGLRYLSMRVTCTDASDTLKPCRVKPDGQTAYQPIPTGEAILIVPENTTYVRFENISGASSTTIFSTGRM